MKPPEEIAAEIEWSHQGIAAAVRTARAEAWRAGAEAMREAIIEKSRTYLVMGNADLVHVANITAIPELPQEPADG